MPSITRRAPPPAPSTEAAPPPSYEADEEMHGLERFRENWLDEIQQRQADNTEVPEAMNDDDLNETDDAPTPVQFLSSLPCSSDSK